MQLGQQTARRYRITSVLCGKLSDEENSAFIVTIPHMVCKSYNTFWKVVQSVPSVLINEMIIENGQNAPANGSRGHFGNTNLLYP